MPSTAPHTDDRVAPPAPMGERRIGAVNWLGLWTLYSKEVRRFIKVWTQTVAAPAVTTVLFMVIFALALGGGGRVVSSVPFQQFLAPGLMIMAILQNAFANTSSSVLIGKVQGTIIDVLMPPLSAGELTVGYVLGGLTRGILVGFAVALAFLAMPTVVLEIHHPWAVAYFSTSAAVMLSLLGVLTGVWADKFDHAAAVTNFIVVPLSLLSGTFYSTARLPEAWQTASQLNPFFYMIDGFRYGMIGEADSNLTAGVAVTLALNIGLWLLTYRVFRTGYRLKA